MIASPATSNAAGLYVHVPFCSAICPYCDFAVRTGDAAAKHDFVDALRREIALIDDWNQPIDTVYFGGGTPSALAPEQLRDIRGYLAERFAIAHDAVWTLEVNPEDVNSAQTGDWRALGFQRVSLGVQSFRDEELRKLGRRHSSTDAQTAVEQCLSADFDTVSLDLMFGLPNQTRDAWQDSLETAVSLGAPHVSCYQLTIHENTTFGRWRDRNRLVEMPEDEQASLLTLTHRTLTDHGWNAYEVSNFARGVSHQSQHNIKYWSHIPYLGVGPSAHSFDGSRRWWNEPRMNDWQARLQESQRPIVESETLDDDALALETVMLTLRTRWGIDTDAFRHRFGVDLVERNRAVLDALVNEGYLNVSAHAIQPTTKGFNIVDGIALRLRFD